MFNVDVAIGLTIAGVVIAFLGLLVWSLVWVYRDAEERGKPGWAVSLAVLVLKRPVSLLLWIAFRPERLGH